MSRAFVKEQDGPAAEVRVEPELPPGVPNRIRRAGADAFRDRAAALRRERADLPPGGIADNRRAAIDDELRYLDRRIGTFVVTDAPANPTRVSFATRATLVCDDETLRVTIVGVDEVDADRGLVSFASPIGRALLGALVGDEVTVATPRGDRVWEVVGVEPG